MDETTRQQLHAINCVFYSAHADDFARTRDHGWPGWERAWPPMPAGEQIRVLDVGCGDGRFGPFLAKKGAHRIAYTGVDQSAALLERARARTATLAHAELQKGDWVQDDPETALPRGPFEVIVVYGVLHHVPGHAGRRALLETLARRLAPQGVLVATFWRFGAPELASRYAHRHLPMDQDHPATRNIDKAQLETGDHLLFWGDDPHALRYCHYCDDAEIEALLSDLGLERVDTFLSDGRSEDLNRYEVLRRPGD